MWKEGENTSKVPSPVVQGEYQGVELTDEPSNMLSVEALKWQRLVVAYKAEREIGDGEVFFMKLERKKRENTDH